EPRAVNNAQHTAQFGDGLDLLVVDVAPDVVDGAHSRVRHNRGLRSVVNGEGVEETLAVDVGQVHEDTLRVDLSDVDAPEIGQATALQAPRRAGGAEARTAQVDQGDPSDAVVWNPIGVVRRRVERVAPLVGEPTGVSAGRAGRHVA